MILLDSNIVIYAAAAEEAELPDWLAERSLSVSAVSLLEVLGFHRLRAAHRPFLERFFENTVIFPINDAVLYQAIALRQLRKMSLGDALVAATALVHDLALMTRNTKDFAPIVGLRLLDSFPPER